MKTESMILWFNHMATGENKPTIDFFRLMVNMGILNQEYVDKFVTNDYKQYYEQQERRKQEN